MKPKKMVKSKMVAKGSGYGQDVLRKHNLVNDPSTGRFKAAGAKKKLVKLGTNAFKDIKRNTRFTRKVLTERSFLASTAARIGAGSLMLGALNYGLANPTKLGFAKGVGVGVTMGAAGYGIGAGISGGLEYAGRKLLRNRRKRK